MAVERILKTRIVISSSFIISIYSTLEPGVTRSSICLEDFTLFMSCGCRGSMQKYFQQNCERAVSAAAYSVEISGLMPS